MHLAPIAVNRFRRDAGAVQLLYHAVGRMLRAHEDQGPVISGLERNAVSNCGFDALGTKKTDCSISAAISFTGAMRTCSGSRRICVGQLLDFRRHGGREEQRLPLLRQAADDSPNVGHEAHVEHPVGFVEDENLDRA